MQESANGQMGSSVVLLIEGCDRVGHTLIVSVDATTRDKISFPFNFLYFQLATSFHSDRGITISPSPRLHPTDGVGLAAGPISASLVAPAWR